MINLLMFSESGNPAKEHTIFKLQVAGKDEPDQYCDPKIEKQEPDGRT